MEVTISPQTHKTNSRTPRKSSLIDSQKDLWLAVRQGSAADVDSALTALKKLGANVNIRNACGLTPLHIATWRNRIPIIRRLLAAGSDPDARDGESGWSSLHRAFHFGHLMVASVLIQSGASILLEDSRFRTPVDLVSGPVAQTVGEEQKLLTTEVFSWGNGANYQLGTGNQHVQKLPCRVDSLHSCFIKIVSAAKFHSVAVSSRGEIYTWGFGRGGRLGHPEFDIHSGQAAVITPRQVICGLGSRRVKAVCAAKHHTVIATESGEVFTWGSNREGQLGYTSVDSQPIPRRVSSLKTKIIAVSAANKHTAVVSESGEVFTWGCNREGQLGYGTSNSASNYTPRLVDYLKGKFFTQVSCAKYHTLVLRDDGEVYTWGHRLVTPRRVIISRNLKKAGNLLVNFHRRKSLRLTAIAAGMVYSLALADDGALFYWVSSDSNLRCQQLYSLHGKSIVSISTGKYWAAAVTCTGEVYMWDEKKGKDEPPSLTRVHNMKRATSVSVGETHLMVVASLYHPPYVPNAAIMDNDREEVEELDEGFMFDDVRCDDVVKSPLQCEDYRERKAPSLKSLCEKAAAECIVEPRNAIQLLEIADSLGAENLKRYCEDIVIRNLDFILTVSPQTFASTSPDVLANLEKLMDDKSSESWSFRRLPTPTSTFPVVIDSEDDESKGGSFLRMKHVSSVIEERGPQTGSCLNPQDEVKQCISRQIRALQKKLQQIEILEAKQSRGHVLDSQQIAKLVKKTEIERSLGELGVETESLSSRKSEGSKKKKKNKNKNKQRLDDFDGIKKEIDMQPSEIADEIPEILKPKEGKITTISEDFDFVSHKNDESSESRKNPKPTNKSTKKKNRKGGLSMFLSGALDESRKPITPPPLPKPEGPAWGGAKLTDGFSSLREIQNEQSKTQKILKPLSVIQNQSGDESSGTSQGKLLLSSFLTSKPIAMADSSISMQQPDTDQRTPPWASSGTSPSLARLSLRDIQMQQVRKLQSLSQSPKTTTSGFSVPTSQGSPSESPGTNRWFKPEAETTSSIRSIQIEEKAMKDLRRFYSRVKGVVYHPVTTGHAKLKLSLQ